MPYTPYQPELGSHASALLYSVLPSSAIGFSSILCHWVFLKLDRVFFLQTLKNAVQAVSWLVHIQASLENCVIGVQM